MERANFFVHFVGWGGEKQRLAPGQIQALGWILVLMLICVILLLFDAYMVIMATF